MITSLVFDHALRIRLKAEVPDDPQPKANDAPVGVIMDTSTTSDEALLALEDNSSSLVGTSTESVQDTKAPSITSSTITVSSSPAVKTNAKSSPVASKDKPAAKTENLLGRLNNLVTSDLQNVAGGRDFLMVIQNAPVQFAVAVAFLYSILGWSSLAGLGW
jgi:hypothetical protein